MGEAGNIWKTTMMKSLEKYMIQFDSLNVHVQNGHSAPHKPIMLLSVISLIEQGCLVKNEIPLTEVIEKEFNIQWIKYVDPDSGYKPSVWTPFWHLKNEPFWHLKAKDGNNASIDKLAKPGQSATIGKMRETIKFACLDDDLYQLMKMDYCRNELKLILISNKYLCVKK